MIQINLLPDIKREYISAQKTRNKVIGLSILLVLGVLGALLILFLYVNGAQRFHSSLLDGQIEDRSAQLAKDEDLGRYLTIQNQLSALPSLHSAKGSYSRMFDYLIQLNPAPPDNVRISKLTLDVATKTIIIEGFADNYKALNVFQKTLENAELIVKNAEPTEDKEKMFSAVDMSQVGVGDMQTARETKKVATFTALLTFSDAAFSADVASSIQIPNLNITNSINNTPRSSQLFENLPNKEEEN